MAIERWTATMNANYPPYSMLNSEMEVNYNTAIAYYKQKERAFEQALAGRGAQNVRKRFEQEMSKFAQQWMTDVKRDFYGLLSANRKNKQYTKWKTNDLTYKSTIESLVQSFWDNDKEKYNYAGWGELFERWLATKTIGQDWENKIDEMTENVPQQLVASVFGKTAQKSATRAHASETTTDLLYSTGKTGKDVGQLELTSWLDLSAFNQISDETLGAVLLDEIVKQGIDQTVYGFQLKAYLQGLDNMRWSNSSVIAKQLQELYNTSKSGVEGSHPWSSNYAALYPYYFLSKYVINIINPANVASITPQGLEYTSDMLTHIRFFMGVNWQSLGRQSEDQYGGGEAVMNITVPNPTIFMRDLKGASGMSLSYKARMVNIALYKETITIAEVGFS